MPEDRPRKLRKKNGKIDREQFKVADKDKITFTGKIKPHTDDIEDTPPLELNPPKIIKRYPKQRCSVQGCRKNAVGKDDVCKAHGGNPVVKENLLALDQISDAQLAVTKFDPAMHPMQYIEFSRMGYSDVEIAAEFEVGVGTMRGWAEKFLDFNTAFEIGQAMYEAWWLHEGKRNLDNRGYNTGLYKYLTGNKLGYSDKIESKNLHVHAGVLMVPAQMDKDEWERKAK